MPVLQIKKSDGITLVTEEMNRARKYCSEIFIVKILKIFMLMINQIFDEVDTYVRMIDSDRGDIVKLYAVSYLFFDPFCDYQTNKISFCRLVSFKRGAY